MLRLTFEMTFLSLLLHLRMILGGPFGLQVRGMGVQLPPRTGVSHPPALSLTDCHAHPNWQTSGTAAKTVAGAQRASGRGASPIAAFPVVTPGPWQALWGELELRRGPQLCPPLPAPAASLFQNIQESSPLGLRPLSPVPEAPHPSLDQLLLPCTCWWKCPHPDGLVTLHGVCLYMGPGRHPMTSELQPAAGSLVWELSLPKM